MNNRLNENLKVGLPNCNQTLWWPLIAFGLIITIGLTFGFWEWLKLGGIAKILQEGAIVVIFVCILLINKKNKSEIEWDLKLTLPLVGIVAVAIYSGFNQGAGLVEIGLFTREVLVFYLVYLSARNIIITEGNKTLILFGVSGIFLLQLPISWLKFIAYDVSETGWIGTLHQTAGQFGLIFPLFAIAFLVAYVACRQRHVITTFFFISLFALFGVTNEKRAIVFVLPVFLVGLILVANVTGYLSNRFCGSNNWRSSGKIVLKLMMSAALCSLFLFIVATNLITSLNPEKDPYVPKILQDGDSLIIKRERQDGNSEKLSTNTIIEQFEFLRMRIRYVSAYAVDYLTADYSHPLNLSQSNINENTNIQLGRLELISERLLDFYLIQEGGPNGLDMAPLTLARVT